MQAGSSRTFVFPFVQCKRCYMKRLNCSQHSPCLNVKQTQSKEDMIRRTSPQGNQYNMSESREAGHQANRASHHLFRASQQRQNLALCIPTGEEANAERKGSEATMATTDNSQDFSPAPFPGTFSDDDDGPVSFPCKPVSRNAHSRKPLPSVDRLSKGVRRRVREETRLAANQGESTLVVARRRCTLGPDVAAQRMGGQAVDSIAQRRSSAIGCVTEFGAGHRDRDVSVGLWSKSHELGEYFLVRTRLTLNHENYLDLWGIPPGLRGPASGRE